jgi:hypothetical protein
MTGAVAAAIFSGAGAAFTASIPATLYGSGIGATSSGSVTTASATATVSGGVAAYTYAWAYVSGASGITINTPTGSGTTFTATVAGTLKEASYKVTVTDSLGHTAVSDLIVVTLEWIDSR